MIHYRLYAELSHEEKVLLKKLYDDQPLEVDKLGGTQEIRNIISQFNAASTTTRLETMKGTLRLYVWLRKNRKKHPPQYRIGYKGRPQSSRVGKRGGKFCPHCGGRL